MVYGAGKNLFTNPMISFFMHNLGAYRIDRRIKSPIYKQVLKTYSCVMLERGYHSLFFPGGTRSRSGMIENRLKLGLAGTALEAYARSAIRARRAAGSSPRPLFFVPVTINYALVLEAESLIEDYLSSPRARPATSSRTTSSRQLDRWLAFFRRLTSYGAACVLRYGPAIDAFGNRVDAGGQLARRPAARSSIRSATSPTAARSVLDAGARCGLHPRARPRARRPLPARDGHHDHAARRPRVVSSTWSRTRRASTSLVACVAAGTSRWDHGDYVRDLPRDPRSPARAGRGQVPGPPQFLPRDRQRRAGASSARPRPGTATTPRQMVAHRRRTQVVIEDPGLLLYYQNRLVPFAEQPSPVSDEQRAAREISALRWRLCDEPRGRARSRRSTLRRPRRGRPAAAGRGARVAAALARPWSRAAAAHRRGPAVEPARARASSTTTLRVTSGPGRGRRGRADLAGRALALRRGRSSPSAGRSPRRSATCWFTSAAACIDDELRTMSHLIRSVHAPVGGSGPWPGRSASTC